MSDVPSWLQDEPVQDVAESIAKNPAAQKAAKQVASNPAVQKAVIDAATNQAVASWADESNNRGSGGGDYANADDVEAQLDSNGKRINPYAALVAATPKEQIDAMKTFHGMVCACTCSCMFLPPSLSLSMLTYT
jgi:membrane protein involved in colicin uptake